MQKLLNLSISVIEHKFLSHSSLGFFGLEIGLCRLYATYPYEFLLEVNSKAQAESNNYVSRVQLIILKLIQSRIVIDELIISLNILNFSHVTMQ